MYNFHNQSNHMLLCSKYKCFPRMYINWKMTDCPPIKNLIWKKTKESYTYRTFNISYCIINYHIRTIIALVVVNINYIKATTHQRHNSQVQDFTFIPSFIPKAMHDHLLSRAYAVNTHALPFLSYPKLDLEQRLPKKATAD